MCIGYYHRLRHGHHSVVKDDQLAGQAVTGAYYGLLTAPTVKQEEAVEEGEKNGTEEAGHSVEEASGLEEPMTDSPNNVQDGELRTAGSSDTGTRPPNGNLAFSMSLCDGEVKPREPHNRWSHNEVPVIDPNEPVCSPK